MTLYTYIDNVDTVPNRYSFEVSLWMDIFPEQGIVKLCFNSHID